MGKQHQRTFSPAKGSLSYSTGGEQMPTLLCSTVWNPRMPDLVLSNLPSLFSDYKASEQKD